jgi:hypothetical protein
VSASQSEEAPSLSVTARYESGTWIIRGVPGRPPRNGPWVCIRRPRAAERPSVAGGLWGPCHHPGSPTRLAKRGARARRRQRRPQKPEYCPRNAAEAGSRTSRASRWPRSSGMWRCGRHCWCWSGRRWSSYRRDLLARNHVQEDVDHRGRDEGPGPRRAPDLASKTSPTASRQSRVERRPLWPRTP